MNLQEIATPPKNIAVVGLSDNPTRVSFQVANYLQNNGFEIIPVNPMIQSVLGHPSYPSIDAIPKDIPIDIVDIFRRSEDVLPIVTSVIATGRIPVIWMQEGVVNEDAKKLAEEHGLQVVMDKCLRKVHQASSL